MTQPNNYRKIRKQIKVLRNLSKHLEPSEAQLLYVVINELEKKSTAITTKKEQK